MRIRILPLVGVPVVGLTLAVAFLPAASGGSVAVPMTSAGAAHDPATQPGTFLRCYSQITGNGGGGAVSQNFEDSLNGFDSQGAVDFTLKRPCMVRSVDAYGVYTDGSGPADSENITIYKDRGGVPGAVIAKRNSGGTDIGGDFFMSLGKGVSLKAAKYWLSVQVNMDFNDGGVWTWNTNKAQVGYPSVWRNPGDGFGTGCTKYTALTTCMPSGVGPDFTFDIRGTQ